ncbi:LacI family DNA-binding transcriptional regulator [Candidatus Sumerlaeota bacterium]|nr:LacI family DNA-binding transcriptional regulator [Candidatus Sumerlaeota bacterium]
MSIIEIAKKAGVSYATVSRVINGRSGVSKETLAKVNRVLNDIGYTPPPRGRRRGPSIMNPQGIQYGALALLWTCSRAEAMCPVASSLLHGANAAAVKEGLNLVVDCISETGLFPQLVEAGKVDGVLIVGPEPSADLAEKLRRMNCVWLLSRGATSWGDRIESDHTATGRIAFEILRRRGHRRLACIYNTSELAPPAFKERSDNFVAAARQAGMTAHVIEHAESSQTNGIYDNEFDDQVLKELIERLIAIDERPTGIFVASDIMVPLHHEMIRRQLRPGRDFELVCCNVENLRSVGVQPSPLVISIQPELIGRLAVDRILWRAQNPQARGIIRTLVHPVLMNPDEPSLFEG